MREARRGRDVAAVPRREYGRQFVRGDWLNEEVALAVLALDLDQGICQRHDRVDDRAAFGVAVEALDETPIDLKDVQRQLAEAAQSRVAGAEIVQAIYTDIHLRACRANSSRSWNLARLAGR
jgi:hypothetical protein